MTDTTGSIDWNSRLLAAARAFKPDTSDDGVEFEKLLGERLGISRAMGCAEAIKAVEDDEVFKFGDFREAFKEKPIVVLRLAFKALRGGKFSEKPVTGSGEDPRLAQLREAGFKPRMENADTSFLLGLYLPDKPNDPVTDALRKRFNAEPIIAFDDDGKVNVAATMEYVSGIEQGFPKSETVNVDGRLVKLWPVGVKPDIMVDEDPLFPGSPLRNGVSVINHRNWSKVDQNNRQFCRLVLERGMINPENHEAVLRLLERAQEGKLSEVYPEVDMLIREKAKRGELPKLRVQLGATTQKQNPFGVRRQY